jgi:hypothetical protein
MTGWCQNIAVLLTALLLWVAPLVAAGGAGTGSANPGAGRVEDLSGVGTRGAEFLTIPVGPRGVAMGGAFRAVADDINSIYWNPAGLGFLSRPEVLLTVIERPLDIRYSYGAVAVPVWDQRMVLGAFISVLNSGDQEITTEIQPDGTGAFYNAYSLSAGGSLAYNFSDRFSAGITVKNVHEDIYGLTQDALAFDMGTNYHDEFMGVPVRLAFAVTNMGTNLGFGGDKLRVDVEPEDIYPGEDVGRLPRKAYRETSKFPLPTSFHISASAMVLQLERQGLLAAVEFSENSNLPISVGVGTEYSYRINSKSTAALRAGWRVQTDETSSTGNDTSIRGLSAGGGYSYRLYKIHISADYAWRDMGLLGSNHAFSLSFGF